MRPHLKLTAVLVIIAVAGCAVFASKREYCLFREITETQDIVQLALLYDQYTTEFPGGVYASELEKMRPEIERELFVGAGQERGLLHRYIEIFPDGIFAVLARDKIAQLDAMIRFETEKAAAYEAAKKAEIDAHEAARQILVTAYNQAITDWIAIAGLGPYGMEVEDLAAVSPRFKEIWSSMPLASCDMTSCVKHYVVEQWYQVPGGTRENRRLELAVKIVFDQGKILGISLTFPKRGVLPLLEEVDKVPYDMEASSFDGATFLVMDMLEQSASGAMPEGQEAEVEGAMWAWSSAQASISFHRKGDLETGVDDVLLIQLKPPPPPEPTPEEKKKKKKPEPVPPPPVVSPEDLQWTPPPAAGAGDAPGQLAPDAAGPGPDSPEPEETPAPGDAETPAESP